MGSRFRQHTRSAASVSFSLQLTPLDCRSALNVDRQVLFGRPLLLLPSAGVQSIEQRAGRSGAILMTCPANRNLLSPTMSCRRLCLVRASTSAFDTLSFHPPVHPEFTAGKLVARSIVKHLGLMMKNLTHFDFRLT